MLLDCRNDLTTEADYRNSRGEKMPPCQADPGMGGMGGMGMGGMM